MTLRVPLAVPVAVDISDAVSRPLALLHCEANPLPLASMLVLLGASVSALLPLAATLALTVTLGAVECEGDADKVRIEALAVSVDETVQHALGEYAEETLPASDPEGLALERADTLAAGVEVECNV